MRPFLKSGRRKNQTWKNLDLQKHTVLTMMDDGEHDRPMMEDETMGEPPQEEELAPPRLMITKMVRRCHALCVEKKKQSSPSLSSLGSRNSPSLSLFYLSYTSSYTSLFIRFWRISSRMLALKRLVPFTSAFVPSSDPMAQASLSL